MIRDICHITRGWMVWQRYKAWFGLDSSKVVLVLAGENRKVDKYALLHLKDYVKRKVAEQAVILVTDKKAWKQAKAMEFPFEAKIYAVKKKDVALLHDYYCFEEYFDNIAFTYVRKPKDNRLWQLLKETDVNEEDVACLGCYCLRRVPE